MSRYDVIETVEEFRERGEQFVNNFLREEMGLKYFVVETLSFMDKLEKVDLYLNEQDEERVSEIVLQYLGYWREE